MLFTNSIELYEKYLITIDRSQQTVRGYLIELRCLNRFLEKKYNGLVYLEDLKVGDFEAYLLHLKQKGDAPASRRRMVYIIRALYNFCIKKDMVLRNEGMKLDSIPVPQKERDYLNEDEFEQLIGAIEHRLIQLAVVTMFFTGLRVSECLHLTLEDVDLAKKSILVRNTKSKKDRRIPINDKLLPILLEYLCQWREGSNSDLFFATKKTGMLSPGYVNIVLHKATQELEWNRVITCHNLRHSFASNLVKKKVDLVRIQKLLGHSSLKVTGIYTHADTSELEEAVNAL